MLFILFIIIYKIIYKISDPAAGQQCFTATAEQNQTTKPRTQAVSYNHTTTHSFL
jgi:hypothetical protein